MYGYRHANESNLMTNLNSISSSLSSIDTVSRRANAGSNQAGSGKPGQLIAPRTHSVASTSLLWRPAKHDRYAASAAARHAGARYAGSDIYYATGRPLKRYCFRSQAALQFTLIPLLLLTICRQVFDFLGQIWLQIVINFFTIIVIILALFGLRQARVSYLGTFALWSLFNAAWNLIVMCVYNRFKDVGLTEDALSLYTGATSWWHSNGPGCLPHGPTSLQQQPPLSILQSTGCKLDYRLVEAAQAGLHSMISFFAVLLTCCAISSFRDGSAGSKLNSDKSYQLNNLTGAGNGHSRVNQDPCPSGRESKYATGSLRRPQAKASSRSSQHSIASARSARRRSRLPSDTMAGPTPRGSTSSAQRSHKYGSLSSRRGQQRRESRRSGADQGSNLYGSTGPRGRPRLSSLSSADYLPSYQPPHASNANLLSSYGEASSIDSYNNNSQRGANRRPLEGAANPTYSGSRSSVYSHGQQPLNQQNHNNNNTNNTNTNNNNNYDDLSYIYGYSSGSTRQRRPNGNQNGTSGQPVYQNSTSVRNSRRRARDQPLPGQTQTIHAEAYHADHPDHNPPKVRAPPSLMAANGSLHSFAGGRSTRAEDLNNNHLTSVYTDKGGTYVSQGSNGPGAAPDKALSNGQGGSQRMHNGGRQHIYTNHAPSNGTNSETPI